MLSKRLKRYVACLLILAVAASSHASLHDKITQILARKDQEKVNYGILITAADSGKKVFALNENTPMTPASNMKLLTSFASLKYLGREFEFVTTAALSDKTLVIIGSGDSLLGLAGDENQPNDFISAIVNALKQKGITEIQDIVIDSTVFDDIRTPDTWPKDQLNRPYACEVSGLNYNGNCVKILVSQSSGQINLVAEPQTDYLRLINKVTPIAKGDSAVGSYRTEKENVIIVHGKCRTAASFDVAIERPSAFFGFLLAESLNKAGITAKGHLTVKGVDSENLQILVEHKTPITEVLKRCNKDSLQLAAESLFKTLGARLITGGKSGSWPAGQRAVTEYLIYLGADKDNFNIDDGSGLSSTDKVTASLIVRVLSDARKSDLWPVFRDTLAQGGIDGTLRKYYDGKYKGKVFAKTGYINGVRALSGLCIAGDKEYIFSILANNANYKSKAAIYDIVKAIIDEGGSK